jgi:transcriptional regulator with XRE-family HTH domain
MQALFITPPLVFQDSLYDPVMHPGGRPSRKPRSSLGQRIAQARERSGISQAQLAKILGTTQPAIAYWERNAANLRSDVLAKIAQILEVSTDEILGIRAPRQTLSKPIGKARQLFESVSRLPRRQQQKITEVVEALVEKQTNGHKKSE